MNRLMNSKNTATPQPPRRHTITKAGFTIVELLAVVLIMAILAGIVLGIAGYGSRRASDADARAGLQQIRNALANYEAEVGRAFLFHGDHGEEIALSDLQIDILESLVEHLPIRDFDAEDEDKVRSFFSDPWGNSYVYRVTGRYSYEVWSWGPTGSGERHDIIR